MKKIIGIIFTSLLFCIMPMIFSIFAFAETETVNFSYEFFSDGSLWLIAFIAALVVATVVTFIISKKKKK